MRLCRYNDNALGLVRGDQLVDVSQALEALPPLRWPVPPGDQLIANLERVKAEIERIAYSSFIQKVESVKLLSPVANPSKIIGAPANYMDHVAEAKADAGIHHGRDIKTIAEYGLFLKSSSSLVGPGEGVAVRFPDRRNDHEVELAVIIGSECENVPADEALDTIAGYAIALDITIRGPEDRSLRKSIDSYSVLGPWLVTADEIDDPDNLDFRIKVNGETRQDSNTRFLIFSVKRLIEYASRFYRLYPGDIIMTGTPQGVGPIVPGDVMECEIERIGRMTVQVRAHGG